MYRIIGADGKEYGPISADQMRQWIAEGRANAGTPVLAQGATEWKTLGLLAEFSLLFAGTAPSSAPSTYAPGTHKSSALATTALILGVISVLSFFCCCCGYGLPFNILGLIFSLIALGQINSHPDRYEGKGLAIGALVLCLISLALTVILFIIFILSAVAGQPIHHVYRL
jgi:hypothetical protein